MHFAHFLLVQRLQGVAFLPQRHDFIPRSATISSQYLARFRSVRT